MGSVQPLLLAGFIVLVIGNVLHMVGMFTPAWTTRSATDTTEGIELGPFRACIEFIQEEGGGERCYSTQDEIDSDDHSKLATELRAVAAMLILGMIPGLVSAGVVALVLVLHHLDKERPVILNFASLAVSVASVLFIIIGVIVWATTVHDDLKTDMTTPELGWSFILSIIGAVAVLLGGLLATIGALRGRQSTERLLGLS